MRYTVLTSRTFHHRITRYLGGLVGAALIATLGLPGAAQAQVIDSTVTFTDGAGFKVTWLATRLTEEEMVDNWIVTLTQPGGTKIVVDQHSYTNTPGVISGNLGVVDNDAPTVDGVTYGRNDEGTWWFQVDACLVDWGDGATGDDSDADASSCPSKQRKAGAKVGYTHGAFPAPANFDANAVPGGVALTWSPVVNSKKDQGFVTYQYRMDEGDEEGAWKNTMADGALVVSDVDPGDYTFMLRVLGVSDNDLNTDMDEVEGMAKSKTVTVPMPTPTLPEIAALFLAMLLLGSGAYLLRRRQSGGLTHA